METILIVEDEADIAELVKYHLVKEGFAARTVGNGTQALELIVRDHPDLIILDLMLPGKDGLEICRRLRSSSATQSIPIIMLTARAEEVDRIVGLEIGADDYVPKPFSPRELVARAKAILRRQERGAAEPGDVVEIRGLRLDARTQDVSVRGAAVDLSALEFKLLHFLASHPRQVFSRERLLDEVWGRDCSVTLRTVDVHIRRLREKIEAQPESPEYIGTVRGAGYRLLAEPQET